jgi:hypothetical protein
MTITRMLSEMSSQELLFWEQKHRDEFLGDERVDYGLARIEAAILNMAGRKLPEGKTFSPVDLMPFREDLKAEPLLPEQVADKVHLAFSALVGQQQAATRRKDKAQQASE